MRLLLVVCLAVLACSDISAKRSVDKVKVAVYYEALCPDSKKFIVSQLAPVWRDLRGAIKVKLVPYGKATHEKKNGVWEFTCQHGPKECYGNKVQSCILKDKNLVDTDKVDMIVCLMSQTDPDTALQLCAERQKKSNEYQQLKECADTEKGSVLLAVNGDKTDALMKPLTFVPTIVINEKHDSAYQNEAMTNLKGLVCKMAVTKPSACT